MLGCGAGIVLFLLALLLVPAVTYGPGRGFVIVVAAALVGAVAAYLARRIQLSR